MVSSQSSTLRRYDLGITYTPPGGSATLQEFMLARDETGGLAYKCGLMQEMLDQQRTDAFSYEHRDSRLDIPASFEDFSLGAGFEDAPDTGAAGSRGYNFTQGVDLSHGARGYLSHLVQAAGSALTTTGAKKFLLSPLGLFAINTRYVYLWETSAWTAVLDSGAGGVINDIFEFSNSTDNYVIVALAGGPYYYTVDGSTFTISEAASSVPAFRATATANSGGASTLTPAEPAGAAQNDILIMVAIAAPAIALVSMNDTTVWNAFGYGIDSDSGHIGVFWARRGASAPDYQVNFSASAACTAVVCAYSGCNTAGTPINATGNWQSGTASTSHIIPSLVTIGANRLVTGLYASSGNGGAATPPGGMTERADANGANGSIEIVEIAAATAGTYGPYTATSTNSVVHGTFAFALEGTALTGASDITRWVVRGQSSGAPVLWGIDSRGNIRQATLVTVPSNWSAADEIQIGQRNATQLGLEVIDNEFFLVHDGGITSYDGTTVSTVFASPFASPPSDAARPIVGYENHLILTFGTTLAHFDPVNDNKVEKLWPRGPQQGNAELNGTITAICSSEKFLYFAIKNSAGNYYIMQMDRSNPQTVGGETIYPAHSILYRGSSAVTALAYIEASSLGLSSTNPTLMLTSGLTVSYVVLPRPGLRPEDDSNCRSDTTADRTMYGSFVNFRAQGFPKWLTRGDIEAKTTTTETIALQYQVPTGTATALTTANTAQTGRTTATLATPVSFTRVRYKGIFNTGANTASPALRGFVLHAAPNAPRDTGFVITVRLKDDQETNQINVRSRYPAANQKAFLLAAVNQIITLRDIYGTNYTTKLLGLQPVAVRYDKDGHIEELVEITLGQLTS